MTVRVECTGGRERKRWRYDRSVRTRGGQSWINLHKD